MQFLSLLALFAASASAYKVLTPGLNTTITKGTTLDVKWTSVDTDADTFSIYLVNFQTAHWPPTVLSLAQKVPRDSSSLSVRIPCDLSSDYGWQLNFINGTNTYVIYAQSPVFSLTGDCIEPAPTPATHYGNSTVTIAQTVVQTVVYETPVVWFVQPTNLVSAAAICPGGPQQTVTVYAPGAAPQPTAPTYGNKTTSTATLKATGTASTGYKPTSSLTPFTGAGSVNRVSVGAAALVAGAVALLL